MKLMEMHKPLEMRKMPIGNVNQAKDQALQNINNADTNGNVTSAKNTGVNAIEQLTVTPVKTKRH